MWVGNTAINANNFHTFVVSTARGAFKAQSSALCR